MSKRIFKMLVTPLSVVLLISISSCKSKTSDADIKATVDKAIAAIPYLPGVYADVKDGVVTLSGEVKDESAKAGAESAVKSVYGVKSVVNNITVAPPPARVEVTADDPLKLAVDNSIKAYPGVTASVQDGVVTLTGQIKRADLQNLMIALNALKPRKIENKLTIN